MGAEECGYDVDGAVLVELARHAQHLRFRRHVEPVTRFDLDSRDAFGQQAVEPEQSRTLQFRFARLARGSHGGDDAATLLGDLGIGHTGEPHLEFCGAIATVDEVSVAVDQTGGHQLAATVHGVASGGFGARAHPGNLAILDQDGGIIDQAIAVPHGRDLQIGQEHDQIPLV